MRNGSDSRATSIWRRSLQLLLSFLLSSSAGYAEPLPVFDAEHYAGRILHLSNFTTLPYRICLWTDTPQHRAIRRRLMGSIVKGRPVQVRIINTDTSIVACDVLHFSDESGPQEAERFVGVPVLTISTAESCRSLVCSLIDKPRIDWRTAKAAGIRFSSELHFQFRHD